MLSNLGLLISSIIVLIYSAMSVDAARKCSVSRAPKGEKSILEVVNIIMLIVSILGILYSGYSLYANSKAESHANAMEMYKRA